MTETNDAVETILVPPFEAGIHLQHGHLPDPGLQPAGTRRRLLHVDLGGINIAGDNLYSELRHQFFVWKNLMADFDYIGSSIIAGRFSSIRCRRNVSPPIFPTCYRPGNFSWR